MPDGDEDDEYCPLCGNQVEKYDHQTAGRGRPHRWYTNFRHVDSSLGICRAQGRKSPDTTPRPPEHLPNHHKNLAQ